MLQKLSLVIPFFNEADSLPELYDRVRQSADACVAAGQIACWELWLIDDGSTDDSRAIAQRFVDADHRVGLIVFRKNRGKAACSDCRCRFCRSQGGQIPGKIGG